MLFRVLTINFSSYIPPLLLFLFLHCCHVKIFLGSRASPSIMYSMEILTYLMQLGSFITLSSVRKQMLYLKKENLLQEQWDAHHLYTVGRKKKKNILQVTIFVPPLRVPVQFDDIHKMFRGLIPKDLVDRISSLCNQIVFVVEDTGGSAIPELQRALEEYLSLIVGHTKTGSICCKLLV